MKKTARILQIVPSTGFGGISSMLMNLYRNVDRTKVQFDFAAFNRGPLHEEICSLGGRVFYFDYIKKQGALKYVASLRGLINKNGPYTAIHVHNGYKGGFALLAGRLAGIDTRVCHIHTSNVEQTWQKPLVPILKSFATYNATKLIACGQEAGKFMYGKRDFEVLTNAINTSSFSKVNPKDVQVIRKELGIPDQSIVIGHIGRFSDVKNHDFMVEIAEKLVGMNTDFRMIFVGDGPLKKDIEQKAHEKGLRRNIIFTGLRSDIPELVNLFDLYLFPSLFEGLPVSLLEAQAAALPCLVSTGVPKESDIGSGLIKFMDLSTGSEKWAEDLLIQVNKGKGAKEVVHKKLVDAGYDIGDNTHRLMEIYGI